MIQLFCQARNKHGKTMAIMKTDSNEWSAITRAKSHAKNKKWTHFEVIQKRKVCASLGIQEEEFRVL